jgi:hypothetical protein
VVGENLVKSGRGRANSSKSGRGLGIFGRKWAWSRENLEKVGVVLRNSLSVFVTLAEYCGSGRGLEKISRKCVREGAWLIFVTQFFYVVFNNFMGFFLIFLQVVDIYDSL